MLDFDNAMKEGINYHQQGKLDEAFSIYNSLNIQYPEKPECLFLLGTLEGQRGEYTKGRQYLERALVIMPDYPEALNSLGIILKNSGEVQAAIRCLKRAVSLKPDFLSSLQNLGIAYDKNGQHKLAEKAFRKALLLAPDDAGLHNSLGISFQSRGDYENAEASFRKAITVFPHFSQANLNLANTLIRFRNFTQAMQYAEVAVQLMPESCNAYNTLGLVQEKLDMLESASRSFLKAVHLNESFPEAYKNLADVYVKLNLLERAKEACQKAIDLNSEYVSAFNTLGVIFSRNGQAAEAEASYNCALKKDPGNANAYNNLGALYLDEGKLEKAEHCFEKAIALKPEFTVAYRHLSRVHFFSDDDEKVDAIEAMLKSGELDDADQMQLSFTLAKAYEDIGNYSLAFNYMEMGNRLKRSMVQYDFQQDVAFFQSLRSLFTREFIQSRQLHSRESPRPVFIVGMPRSGTTLTEQILASHTEVYGAGEIDFFDKLCNDASFLNMKPYPQCMLNLDKVAFERMASAYKAKLSSLAPDYGVVTDKLTGNFIHIGMIKILFPEAKIIHCSRHPIDNCLSLYKQYFTSGNLYSYDQMELCQYYQQYQWLMEHWKAVTDHGFYECNYEKLVADPEAQIRAILDYCNLDFQQECMLFHQTNRLVKTASAAQVRQPIYKKAVNHWENYAQELKPFVDFFASSE